MPALKYVSLQNCVIGNCREEDHVTFSVTWDNLEHFVLTNSGLGPQQARRNFRIARLHPGLRSLELPTSPVSYLCGYKYMAERYEATHDQPLPLAFERLEHLRLSDYKPYSIRGSLVQDATAVISWFVGLLAPSISSGTLTSLDIPFDDILKAQLDQALDKNAIRTLSCNALNSRLGQFGILNTEGDDLLTWLDEFPNVTTVGIFPEDAEMCGMIIAKLLAKENKINTIYTNALTGMYRDDALAKAAKKGIKLIHADRVPEPILKPLDKSSGSEC